MPLPRRGLALLCALAVWVLGVLGTSAELHGALHAEAGHADHTCAITLFSHGLENPTPGAELVVAPLALVVESARIEVTLCVPACAHRLPPGCGPPAC
jgi:hypothetical protein